MYFQFKATILFQVLDRPVLVLNNNHGRNPLFSPPGIPSFLSIVNNTIQCFEVDNMCNSWYVNPRPKSSRGHDIGGFILEPSLETGLLLSKKVSIIVLRIPVVVVVSELLGQYFAFSIANVVDYTLFSRYQTPQPGFHKLLDFHWSLPIPNPEYRVLDINVVAKYVDIKGILQLYNLLKFPLGEQRQGPSQEHEQTAEITEEYQPPELPPVLISNSKCEMILVNNHLVKLPPDTQIGSLL